MLGMDEYYQECIAAYADLVQPFTQLTCKTIPFLWTDQCH